MTVEQLRRLMADSEGRTAAPPISRAELTALLDIAEATDVLSGHARHENNCDRTLALLAGRGLSQGGPGAPCNCGFKDALATYQEAVDRLDTEGGT